MTNEMMTMTNLDLDTLRPFRDFDDMLSELDKLDLIPTSIDYILDDAHADPAAYIPSSSTFHTANNLDPDNFDESAFYDNINADAPTLQINFRMMLEMICAEMTDSITETTARLERASSILA